ncbi:MAG: T9SS type A sorting domain-containing protein [Chitinophagales bacterium]|jgi:streptogramin lyase|nr:T9SS type A sorting domain-containing protein [Bacteroidota bacterium]MBK7569519.1 T9SS type A sorting domain-containing protein [Bacteroidota bacterium]MBP8916564.1 T9SS type A sorting domain-containing protein [Chitinophagales bacterium]MBP9221647.1 T9SS type A sorting domain-containing protein [Chitinophagales bacterium]MBP9794639.1 T9SS type A sorting domain-containing protein [Chitinophagales bacterium]
MKKLIYIFAFLLLGSQTEVFGQSWENYSNITAITDAEPIGDHIWTSCKGGVIDINTTTGVKTYHKMSVDGLPSASIEQVAISSVTSVIWVGTYDAGVVEWDGENWITYDFPASFQLYRMKFDMTGNLWLQTDGGLYKFDCTSHEYTFVNSIEGIGWDMNAWDFDITPDNNVLIFTGTNCLVIDAVTNTPIDSFPNSDSPTVLACSPTTVRLYGVDEDTYLINNFGFLEFQFKDGTYAPAEDGLPEFAFVNNIVRGFDNALYCFVDNVEIYKLVGFSWELVKTVDTYSFEKLLFANGTDFYLNEYAYLNVPSLIKADASGMDVFDTKEFNFTSNNIQGLTINGEGDILMLSASKIYSYNADINNWEFYVDAPSVYGAYDLKYINDMLYAIDYGNLIEYYDGVSWTHIPYADGYSSIYIFDYDVTADGVVYFVNEEGLFKSEGGVTELLIETYAVSSWFMSVEYDEARGLLWLGRINGIVKYDFVTEDLINSSDVAAMADGSSIQEISCDDAGNVWFGANNNKVYMYDGTEWTDFTVGNDGDFIIEFAFQGTKVYFGLTDGTEGFHSYDTNDGTWEYFNTSEDASLISNALNFLVVDEAFNIWMATSDAGISLLRAEVDPVDVITMDNESIKLFPNPAADHINIETAGLENMNIQIVNINGSVVLNTINKTNSIDISGLANGIYLLKVISSDNSQNYTTRFCIAK